MTDENDMMQNTAGSQFEGDDTMERNIQTGGNQNLPLHPILVDEEDNQGIADQGIVDAGNDADNTETSAVSAVGSVADSANAENAANSFANSFANSDASANSSADAKAGNAANSSNLFSSFPLPDLREREDGGAIDFDEEDTAPAAASSKISDEIRSKSRAEFTTVYDIIDSMESTLMESKGVLFSQGMVKIDRDEFADQLSRLKDMLPVQLERASALMREAERRLRTAQTQASSIVSSAQSQSAEIIDEARERARFLAGQENVTALARQKASDILAKAQEKSNKLIHGANQYCATVMEGLKQQLDKLEQDVQAGQRVLDDRCRAAEHVQNDLRAELYKNAGEADGDANYGDGNYSDGNDDDERNE